MQDSINLVEMVREKGYFLMTNADGREVYDDDGNLLLYEAGGHCLSVPNTDEMRRLYELPLDTPEVKDTIKKEDVCKPGNLVRIQDLRDRTVWMGQKNEHSIKATKMLIKLFDSPKYQPLMKNPNVVKLKVWEKIAEELEENGFKIATNSREAGLRTFQKWRNMERTYWKFMKMGPGECGEDNRRKKPYFFDDLHAILSMRTKEAVEPISSFCNDSGYKCEEDDEDDVDADLKCESELQNQNSISDLHGTDCEAFPRQALKLLTSLVTSSKYDECFKAQSHCPNKTKVWENIYMDMMKAGWKFGSCVKEGALILSEKWRLVEKTILRKKLCKPRTLYTPILRKAMLTEIERRKAIGSNYSIDPPSPPNISNLSHRKPKSGEIEVEAIEALMKVVSSGHYQNLFATSGGKRAKIWEKIFEEIQSKGFQIPGETKREKITRLFQKWRNMKRAFVKYQVAKFRGKEMKKPMFYEMMFKIIANDILSMHNSDCDSDEEMRAEEWDEESESEYPLDFMELYQVDHDYGRTSGTEETGMMNSQDIPSIMGNEQTTGNHSGQSSLQCKPLKSKTSKSHDVLKQIKSLHETSLAMQQQNFTKIISLLENQISQQNKLTTAITEYITSQTLRSNSKNGHNTENLSQSKKSSGKISNTLKDENFSS